MRRIIAAVLLASSMAGCGDGLCEDHRAMRWARGEEERERIERRIEGLVAFELIGVGRTKSPPVLDCPKCDKLAERMLATRRRGD